MKQLFFRKFNSITGAAVILAVASLLSRLLGIVRDRVLASQFGASSDLDIYYAAFRIPDLVYNLLVLGALSAGFIPILSKFFSEKKEQEGWEFSNYVLNLVFLAVVCVSLIAIVFAPWIMPVLTPGFSEQQMSVLIDISRLMFLSPIFLAMSAVFGGILQTFRQFVLYSLAPSLYNLGIICGALFLAPQWGIYGLTYGVILGTIFHLCIQYIGAKQAGFKYQFLFSVSNSSVKKLVNLMIPRTFALAMVQLNLVVITVLASNLEEGSLSIFNFANNLQYFPIGIFGISFAIAVFPTLSDAMAQKNKKLFSKTFFQTYGKILFFMLPASVVLYFTSFSIIWFLLGDGAFGVNDAKMTAVALQVFCLSLFAQALIPLLSRAFYSVYDTKSPAIAAIIGFIANIVFGYYFSKYWGITGLILAFSLSSILNWFVLECLVKVKGILEDTEKQHRELSKIFILTVLFITLFQLESIYILPKIDLLIWTQNTLYLFANAIMAIVCFFVFSKILKIPFLLKINKK